MITTTPKEFVRNFDLISKNIWKFVKKNGAPFKHIELIEIVEDVKFSGIAKQFLDYKFNQKYEIDNQNYWYLSFGEYKKKLYPVINHSYLCNMRPQYNTIVFYLNEESIVKIYKNKIVYYPYIYCQSNKSDNIFIKNYKISIENKNIEDLLNLEQHPYISESLNPEFNYKEVSILNEINEDDTKRRVKNFHFSTYYLSLNV